MIELLQKVETEPECRENRCPSGGTGAYICHLLILDRKSQPVKSFQIRITSMYYAVKRIINV